MVDVIAGFGRLESPPAPEMIGEPNLFTALTADVAELDEGADTSYFWICKM